jgi:hypothetical protein
MRGETPAETPRNLITGRKPLLGIGGAAIAGAVAARNKADKEKRL